MDGRKRPKRRPENPIGNENGFPHSRFILRKENEEKKKKGMLEKGKKMGRKCGAEWLTAGGRRASERSILRIKNFVPNGEKKGNNDCILT